MAREAAPVSSALRSNTKTLAERTGHNPRYLLKDSGRWMPLEQMLHIIRMHLIRRRNVSGRQDAIQPD